VDDVLPASAIVRGVDGDFHGATSSQLVVVENVIDKRNVTLNIYFVNAMWLHCGQGFGLGALLLGWMACTILSARRSEMMTWWIQYMQIVSLVFLGMLALGGVVLAGVTALVTLALEDETLPKPGPRSAWERTGAAQGTRPRSRLRHGRCAYACYRLLHRIHRLTHNRLKTEA
jgi:hypothetical protein